AFQEVHVQLCRHVRAVHRQRRTNGQSDGRVGEGGDHPAVHDAAGVQVVRLKGERDLDFANLDRYELEAGPSVEGGRLDVATEARQRGLHVLVSRGRSLPGHARESTAVGSTEMQPDEIFQLIVKADERLKYATDERGAARRQQAKGLLQQALDAAREIGNEPLVQQAQRRL